MRAAGGMNGIEGSISASGGSLSTTGLDTCLTDADCTPCLWAPAPTDPSQCPGYVSCCGGFSATKKRCESNRAAWNAACPNQTPQDRPCPCILLCDGETAMSCVAGRCSFACPTIADAGSDIAFVATDASPDVSLLSSGGASGSGGDGGMGGANTRTGGVVGTSGTVGRGSNPGSGGISATSGTTGSSAVYGMPCTTNGDCPSDAICCDGSDESCDGTRLPSGEGANPGEFVVSEDGRTVRDTITGLVWQRDTSGLHAGCSDGQDCLWEEAEAYCTSLALGGLSGWRLPAAIELISIVDFARANPAIDPTAFPNTLAEGAWTSSPCVGSPGGVWAVNIGDGNSYCAAGQTYQVRCVRGSRCYPTSRFAAMDGGLVRDTLTNLVWQQQLSTNHMTWGEAQAYCSLVGAGFRLPTVKELESILDLTRTNATYPTAFPSTPGEAFWTSSAAWNIDFSYGGYGSSGTTNVGRKILARCVR